MIAKEKLKIDRLQVISLSVVMVLALGWAYGWFTQGAINWALILKAVGFVLELNLVEWLIEWFKQNK